MSKVQGTNGKSKNDLVGISFYEKEPIKPADMETPVDDWDDADLDWRDRCERADRRADNEILYHMRANSEERKPWGGFGQGMTKEEFIEKHGGSYEYIGQGRYRYHPPERSK